MPQIFHPSTNTLSRLTIFGALGIVLGLLVPELSAHAVSLPDASSCSSARNRYRFRMSIMCAGWGSTAAIATRRSRRPHSRACRRLTRA